ncbi:MAG TPA: MCE family protein [Mycobacteriales bacterium]|nr:MCE family protein [Mycobacteriales bacterium]
MRRPGRARRERNPVLLGVLGLVLAGLFLLVAFNADRLPIIGGGSTYAAAFSEAAGLRPGDEVRVAGVKVGAVTAIGLDRDHVRVRFRVKGAWLGDQTSAAIKIKTLLGRKYLALEPAGDRELPAGGEIPLARTTAPYDVLAAFAGLTRTVDAIDTSQLAKAFQTLSATFAGTPAQVRSSLAGLSALSRTVASRDALLRQLLARTRGVTTVLAARSGDLTALISDANKLLTEVSNRRAVISALLTDTVALSVQLSGLVADNRARLGPALTQLHGVLDVLRRNQSNLDRSLALLAPFVRVFANTVGNGRWFDTYLQNLVVPGPLTITPGRTR